MLSTSLKAFVLVAITAFQVSTNALSTPSAQLIKRSPTGNEMQRSRFGREEARYDDMLYQDDASSINDEEYYHDNNEEGAEHHQVQAQHQPQAQAHNDPHFDLEALQRDVTALQNTLGFMPRRPDSKFNDGELGHKRLEVLRMIQDVHANAHCQFPDGLQDRTLIDC